MKIAIITFVRAYNYGAVLQCYALSQKLYQLGHDVEVIDYYPQYFYDIYTLPRIDTRIAPHRPLRKWFLNLDFHLNRRQRVKGFEDFIAKYIPITNIQFKSMKDFDNVSLDYDMYISGSDQVWSADCVPFDPVYFLQFSNASGKIKASYAASFGTATIRPELKKDYRDRLIDWNFYSVREMTGKDILHTLLDAQCTVCCDPTLLIDRKDWISLQKPVFKNKRYVLVYTVTGNSKVLSTAKSFCNNNKTNIEIVFISGSITYSTISSAKRTHSNIINYSVASPNEWISLFFNAEYIFTDSFHGAVFSIIFHKNFKVIINNTSNSSVRIIELLERLSLSSCILKNNSQKTDTPINWKAIDSRLLKFKNDSFEYLNNITKEK